MKGYSDSHWRNHAAPIIQKIINENKGAEEKTLRRLIHDAYPFGQRKYHPYKIWCDEVKRQLNGGAVPLFVDPKDTRKPVFGNKCDPFGEGRGAS